MTDITKSKGGCFIVLRASNLDLFFVRDVPDGKNRLGKMGFVGGTIEDGETPDEAGLRETREELGVLTFNKTVPRLIVHRTPPVDTPHVAPTWLFDIGCHWQTYGTSRQLPDIEKYFTLQKEEVSKVERVSPGDLLDRRDYWQSEFYTGHWKMLGWLLHRMQYAVNEPFYKSTKENPWDTIML